MNSAIIRRIRDIVVAVAVLTIALPVLIISAIAIWVSDPGPILYRQYREGQFGKPFLMMKLRTMYHNADAILERHLSQMEEARAEWGQHLRLANDPRLIRGVGPLLRKLSIDELPNIWNVLKGEMTLVGQR